MTPEAAARRHRLRVVVAFAAVYVLWGSTYLFIRFAVASIPPFVLGATRFLTAGLLLYAAMRLRGAPRPTATEVRAAATSGVLMLGFGNGAVIWASQTVPSGIVALIVACVPLWIVLADWIGPSGTRPGMAVLVGVAIGLSGIAALIGPRAVVGGGHVDPAGAAVLLLGSLSWAVGSVATRRMSRPRSPLVSVAVQMTAAGAAFLIPVFATNELGVARVADVTLLAGLSLAYLVVCGSLIAYTAYIYLLGAVGPAKAATYAYVNPVIAVLVGWAFAGEAIGMRTIAAAAVILAGVAIITTVQSSGAREPD